MSYYVKYSACYHARTPIDKVLAINHGLTQVSIRGIARIHSLAFRQKFRVLLVWRLLQLSSLAYLRSTFLLVIFWISSPTPPPFPSYFMYHKWFCILPSEGGRQTFIPQQRSAVNSDVNRILYLPLIYLLTVNRRNSLITVTMMSSLKRMLGQKS